MSRRSLEVEFTLESGVWSHSGVCSLDSLRSLEVGVFPESVVTPEFVVWSYYGVWSLEFAVIPGLSSGVTPEFEFTQESGVRIHSGAPNLETLRGLESRNNPKYGVWSLDVLQSM